jgi:hypothetical protein
MDSDFLKKYRLSTHTYHKIEDLLLTNPINKNLKPSQIYKDSIIAPQIQSEYYQKEFISPRVSSSLILEPISRPSKYQIPKNHFYKKRNVDYNPEKNKSEPRSTNKSLNPRENTRELRIHSQVNPIRSPHYIDF